MKIDAIRAQEMPTPAKMWDIQAAAVEGEVDIHIYGDIIFEEQRWYDDDEAVSAASFRDELAAAGDVSRINLYVASLGGSFPQALAIASQLKRHPAKVHGHVDGFAASAATMILAACDVVTAPKSAMLLYHAPIALAWGWFNAEDFRALAEHLDRLLPQIISTYQDKNPDITEEQLLTLFSVNDWITSDEALAMGLIDEVIDDPMQVAASARALEIAAASKDLPEAVKAALSKGVDDSAEEQPAVTAASEEERAVIVSAAEASTSQAREVLSGLDFSPRV